MSKKLKTALVGAAIALLVGFAVSYGLISPQTGDQIKTKTDEILSGDGETQPVPDVSVESPSESTAEPSAEPSADPAPAPSAESDTAPTTDSAPTPTGEPEQAPDTAPEDAGQDQPPSE